MQRQITDNSGTIHTILIDPEDIPFYDSETWTVPEKYWGVRSTRQDKLLHRILLDAQSTEHVIHINGDKHDFRRSNLLKRNVKGPRTLPINVSATSQTLTVAPRRYLLYVSTRTTNPLTLLQNAMGYYQYPKIEMIDKFDNCRLLMLGWKLVNQDDPNDVIKKVYLIQSPYHINVDVNIRYHGLSAQVLSQYGRPIQDVLNEFATDIENLTIKKWIGENVQLSKRVIQSEMSRQGMTEHIERIGKIANYDFHYHFKRMSFDNIYIHLMTRPRDRIGMTDFDLDHLEQCYSKVLSQTASSSTTTEE